MESSDQKSNLQNTLPQSNPKHLYTPDSSSPQALTFKNTPSPDRVYKGFKHPQSSLQKHYADHPNSTEQYTPLGVSRSRLLSAKTPEDIDQLIVEHRYEIETLLLQIGRLKEELNQSHDIRELEVRKARQQFQQTSYLQVSQIRQNQHGQAEIYELQIRKLKEQLADKCQQTDKLTTLLKRQKETNDREKTRYQEDVRHLIEKKNTQIYELRQDGDNKLKDFQFQRINELEEIRYTCDKEVANLNKQLQKHQNEYTKLKSISETDNKEKQKIITYLQHERNSVEKRYEQRLTEQTKKYENIRNKFNELINQFSQDSQTSRAELQRLFEAEYEHMMNLVKAIEGDNNELRRQLESAVITSNVERETFKEESTHLNERIRELTDNAHTDMEMLKVKLAALHQNDIKSLKELYDLKLRNAADNIARLDAQTSKLRQFTNVLSAQKYEMKKRYENTISGLNSKILKMRMGFSSIETEYKEKMENEKSVMLMTSRSFMKEAEAKDNSNKFLEEQIRKLRQLMDLQGRENENAERAIEEKVLVANNQLERLSNKVLIIAKEKKDLEDALDHVRSQKDAEIHRLRKELTPPDPCKEEGGVIPEIQIIQKLREELSQKKDEIGTLKDKMTTLESRMKEMEAEMERLQMENNMNSEELKKQFQTVSEKHLDDFRKYFEEKLKRVEEEKAELKKIVSSKSEQITELIKKYKQIEEDLMEATVMMKKRTVLEEKVMNIGLDVNIVKNMTDLLPRNKH